MPILMGTSAVMAAGYARPVNMCNGEAISSGASSGTAKFTVACWVYIANVNSSRSDCIWCETSGTGASIGLVHYNGRFQVNVWGTTGNEKSLYTASTVVGRTNNGAARGWYRVVVTVDMTALRWGTSTTGVTLWVNGVSQSLTVDVAYSGSGSLKTGDGFRVGAYSGATTAGTLDGAVSHFKVWNSVLSNQNILDDYNSIGGIATSPTTELVFAADFDASSAASPGGSATLSNSPTLAANPLDKAGGWLSWAGADVTFNSTTRVMTGWTDETGLGASWGANSQWPDCAEASFLGQGACGFFAQSGRGQALGLTQGSGVCVADTNHLTVVGVVQVWAPIDNALTSSDQVLLAWGASGNPTTNLKIGIDATTGRPFVSYGATKVLAPANMVIPSQPVPFAVVLTPTDVRIRIMDRVWSAGSALAAAGSRSDTTLFCLMSSGVERARATIYALAFKAWESTDAQVATAWAAMQNRIARTFRTTYSKQVVAIAGDSLGAGALSTWGRNWAGWLAKVVPAADVYNFAISGQTIGQAITTGLSYVTGANGVFSATSTANVLVFQGGANLTAVSGKSWANDSAPGAGQALWADVKANLLDVLPTTSRVLVLEPQRRTNTFLTTQAQNFGDNCDAFAAAVRADVGYRRILGGLIGLPPLLRPTTNSLAASQVVTQGVYYSPTNTDVGDSELHFNRDGYDLSGPDLGARAAEQIQVLLAPSKRNPRELSRIANSQEPAMNAASTTVGLQRAMTTSTANPAASEGLLAYSTSQADRPATSSLISRGIGRGLEIVPIGAGAEGTTTRTNVYRLNRITPAGATTPSHWVVELIASITATLGTTAVPAALLGANGGVVGGQTEKFAKDVSVTLSAYAQARGINAYVKPSSGQLPEAVIIDDLGDVHEYLLDNGLGASNPAGSACCLYQRTL